MEANLKEFIKIILISFIASFGLTYFVCDSCRSNATNYVIVTSFSFSLWVSLWAGNDFLAHFLNRKISWVEFPVRRLLIGVAATVLYTVSVVLIIILLLETLLNFDIGNYFWTIASSLIVTEPGWTAMRMYPPPITVTVCP